MLNYNRQNRIDLLNSAPSSQNPLETMRNANAINLSLDDAIYRIFTLDRFLEMIKEGKNTLVRPSMWDDPFENILFSHQYLDSTGNPIDMSSIRDSWYGQCWTAKEDECDGLWRVYSENGTKRCVRVKTTVRKIFEPLYDGLQEHEWQCFIGKVDYSSEGDIIAVLESFAQAIATDPQNVNQMQLLLTKRTEFKYEDEVRILYCRGVAPNNYDTSYQYDVDFNSAFDEVMLDPWCPDRMVKNFADNIYLAGYHGEVTKSQLYAPIKMTTTIV